MKKLFVTVIILISIFFCSCKKNSVIAKPYVGQLEQFVAAYIAANPSITFNTTTTTDIPLEYGTVFQSSKKGIITALGVRMPLAGGVYTVSLWDYDTKQLIKQYQVTNTISTGFNYIDMEAKSETVSIPANKKYVVSVFVKAAGQAQPWPYYYILKPGAAGSAESFIPFTQGSLTCTGTQFYRNATPSFPDQPVLHADIMNGLPDVNFKATEK